jgi:chaperonin GroEL
MTSKHVLFRAEAREKILRGATALADAVRVTLGPRSKCVLIEKKWGRPLVCNDGVTIAKEFDLKDSDENLGSRMLREAAERTGDAVGDGTSTRQFSPTRFSRTGYATSRRAQPRLI